MQESRVLKVLGLGDLSGKGWRTHLSFWSIVGLTFFLFGDQNLASANLNRIGEAFGFTDTAEYRQKIGGHVAFYFFVLGGFMSIVAGALTDTLNRKKLLFWTVFIGELACFATAFAPTYNTYLILRTLTGFGLGGIFPIIFSLLGDYFKAENRSAASGWLALAMGLGIGVGQVLGGILADKTVFGLAGWRASFALMAAPSFPLLFLYLIFGTNPRRGAAELGGHGPAQEVKHRIGLADVKRLFSNRTNVLAMLQGIPGCVPWGLIFTFLVDFYEKSKGFKPADGALLITVFGGVLILGGFMGGFMGRLVYRRRRSWLPIYCGICVLLGVLPMLYIVNYSGTSLLPPMIAAAFGGLVIPQAGPNIRAILQNSNLPENRGSIFGIFNFTDDLGKGFGPFLVGEFLVIFHSDLLAYNIAVLCWLPCALGFFLMAYTFRTDETHVEAEMDRRVSEYGKRAAA